MNSRMISTLQGYVTIQVRGKQPEALLNLASSKGIEIWDIYRVDEQRLQFNILLKHFFGLRPLLRETGCLPHVVKRFGFPFFLNKLEQRKWFGVGIVGFLIGIFVLTSITWQVHVEGNEKIPKEDILIAARQQGIFPMQWKFRMKDEDVLSKELASKLPGISWVGVEVNGAQVRIKIVEARQPEPRVLQSPQNIVSTADAVVTHILAEKGRPIVKENARVRKGDILIKGIYGDEENQQAVVSKGVVRGLVWHEFQIVSPLVQKFKVYTGEVKEKKYILTGNRALQITGYGKNAFTKYEVQQSIHRVQISKYTLPVGYVTEKWMEVRYDELKLDEQTAKRIGLEQARAQIYTQTAKKPIIKAEKILHDKTESGKVYMKVLFEVDEIISEEQSIIAQGE